MNALVWSVLRLWVSHRRGRTLPPNLPDPICYFAYGSNMNDRLFRERRHMTPVETRVGRLRDHRLVFTVAGGMKPGISAPANIVNAPGESVFGLLYLLPLRKFARLDASEGRQYGYLWTEVEDTTGRRVPIVTYQVPYEAPEGRPRAGYLNLIREAAREHRFPPEYVTFLDQVEARE